MQNRKCVFLTLLLFGCSRAPTTVFVDLDEVPLDKIKPVKTNDLKPDIPSATSVAARTLPGEPSVEVENLKADQKVAIRKEVDQQTNDAIATISTRLQDYYSREIDDFYKTEFAKLGPLKQSLIAEYLNAIRPIFEASANKRAPLLTRLTFLTKFPPPETQLFPLEGENLSKSELKRRIEVRELQRSIIEIDHQYELDTRELDAKNSTLLDKQTEDIQTRLKAKQKEIDVRAQNEATRLVKRFSTSLSNRIFSRYTFQLKEIPTKTVNFPKTDTALAVPRVTFDGAQLYTNERAELAKELATFLRLNHYERAGLPEGAKNVTQEFIEWRTNLKSGHWENWQNSSARK
jgi:hypothetical protein